MDKENVASPYYEILFNQNEDRCSDSWYNMDDVENTMLSERSPT